MGLLDAYKSQFSVYFSDWIKINDDESGLTIENFPNGVSKNGVGDHCWKCVTVNHCWFKNEEEKKPKKFDYSDYKLVPNKGLYHFFCHCEEKSINVPRLKEINVLEARSKFNDFFKRKKGIFYGIGYTYKDEEEIINFYIDEVKNLYRSGNYSLYKHWEYGFQINITISISGKNEFKNIIHKFRTGLFIYPNGKLKIATIFAGGD